MGSCDLYLAFKLDSVVGKPRLDDLGRVVDVAASMFPLCGGDVVHQEILYFRHRLSRELPRRYAVELAEVPKVAQIDFGAGWRTADKILVPAPHILILKQMPILGAGVRRIRQVSSPM